METTPRSVKLSELVQHFRRKTRRTMNSTSRRNLSLATKCLEQFGDCVVYEDKDLRVIVADSVAHRLALSQEFTRERFEELHRRIDYGDQGRERDHCRMEGQDCQA